MSRLTMILTGLLVPVLLAASPAPVASSADAAGGGMSRQHHVTRAQVIRDCKAVARHRATKTQRRVCKSHRWAAKLTPGPKRHTKGHTDGRSAYRRAVAQGRVEPLPKANGCKHQRGENGWHWDKKSLVGSLQYHWHLWMSYCYRTIDGGPSIHITKVFAIRDWVDDAQFNVQVGNVIQSDGGTTDGLLNTGWARRERGIQLCAAKGWGCYANLYPNGKITEYGFLQTFGYAGTAG